MCDKYTDNYKGRFLNKVSVLKKWSDLKKDPFYSTKEIKEFYRDLYKSLYSDELPEANELTSNKKCNHNDCHCKQNNVKTQKSCNCETCRCNETEDCSNDDLTDDNDSEVKISYYNDDCDGYDEYDDENYKCEDCDDCDNDCQQDFDSEINECDTTEKCEKFLNKLDKSIDKLLGPCDLEFNRESRIRFVREILCLMKAVLLSKSDDRVVVEFKQMDDLGTHFNFKFIIKPLTEKDYDVFIKAKNYTNDMFDYIFNKDLDYSLAIEGSKAEFDIVSYM